MLPPLQTDQAIVQLVKEERGRILAALVSHLGSLQLAEDALQDAIEVALQRWTSNDLPSSPAAWLLSTARHRAIDHLRRNQRLNQLAPELAYLAEIGYDNCSADPGMNEEVAVPDKRLELMFTCCHLSLAWKTRVALTLKTVAGLDTEQLARAFLYKTSTMAQRLTCAK